MPKPRILVIDDDPMITQLLEEHLSGEGYDVKTVHLSEQGFNLANQSPPDLIFLDVMLPDATGFQTLGRLRKNAATSEVPIIMMSGTARNANQKDIAKGMGATDYIDKPFNVNDIEEKVRQHVKTRPEKNVPPEPEIHFDPEPEPQPEPPPMHELPKEPAFTLPDFDHIEVIPMNTSTSWTIPDHPPAENAAPVIEELPTSSPIEFQNEIPLQEPAPAPTLAPASEPAPAPARKSSWGMVVAVLIFSIHIGMSMFGTEKDPLLAMTYAAGGWALLLGWLVSVCALLGIRMDAGEALTMEGWAAIPIVARAGCALVGFIFPIPRLPTAAFWMRPLDVFELMSLLILGIFIRRLSKSNLLKTLTAVVLIALAWCFTSRGYFHPY